MRLGRLRRLTALRVLRNGSAPRPRLAAFLANLNALVNGPLRELRPTALTPLLAARRTGAVLRLAALLPLLATRFAVLFMRFLSLLKNATTNLLIYGTDALLFVQNAGALNLDDELMVLELVFLTVVVVIVPLILVLVEVLGAVVTLVLVDELMAF